MSIKDLTAEQLEWLKENFCHTKNQELADELGTSPRSVIRMARTLGLWKTSKFVAAMQQNAADHAARANRANGGNAGARTFFFMVRHISSRKASGKRTKCLQKPLTQCTVASVSSERISSRQRSAGYYSGWGKRPNSV